MKKETLYELLKNYEDPNGTITAGVRKTEQQWMARFALLNPGDCNIKTDWFKHITPIYESFIIREFIVVFCCKCGKMYDLAPEYPILFESKDKASKKLQDDGWTVHSDNAYCPECR